MRIETNLRDSPPLQFANDVLHDSGDFFIIDALTRGAAADGLLRESFGGQEALNFVAELNEVLLLNEGLRLATAAGLNAAELESRAESLGEFRRVEHRVEEGQQAIL